MKAQAAAIFDTNFGGNGTNICQLESNTNLMEEYRAISKSETDVSGLNYGANGLILRNTASYKRRVLQDMRT